MRAARQLKSWQIADLIERIQSCLTDDLRKPEYQGNSNPLAGHCYVSAETLHVLLGGKEAGSVACRVKHEGSTHWWVQYHGQELDPTAGQFQTPVPYHEGVRTGFLTKTPSSRACTLIGRVLNLDP